MFGRKIQGKSVTRARHEPIQAKNLGGDLDMNRDRTSQTQVSFMLFLALHSFPTA